MSAPDEADRIAILQKMFEAHHMINPVEYGELKGRVEALRTQMTELQTSQGEQNAKLQIILDNLNQAKGGWRVMMFFGGAAGTVGAALATWASTALDLFGRGNPPPGT